jgi:hypothetical protein
MHEQRFSSVTEISKENRNVVSVALRQYSNFQLAI